MAWFKVDDKLHSSQKLLRIPRRYRLAALGLWTLSGAWSADQLTDGRIPDYMIEEWGAPKNLVDWLVKADLWLTTDEGTAFKNWDEYQPTKADVESGREKNREKLRKWRESNQVQKHVVTGLPDSYEPEADSAPVPSRPVPSRPEVKASPSNEEAKKPETKIPKDWAPTASHIERAKEKGVDVLAQAEAFKLHAETHDRRAASWNAAFTSWLIKSKPTLTAASPSSPWSKEFHQ